MPCVKNKFNNSYKDIENKKLNEVTDCIKSLKQNSN